MIGGALSIAVGGQSLAHRFRVHGKRAFARRLQHIVPDAPPVRVWGYTRGGSLAASTNVFPDAMGRGRHHWWDMAEDRPSAAFDAGLEANAGFLDHRCECLIWDLGQFEAIAMSGRWDRDPSAAAADFESATRRILDHWRMRLSPDEPDDLPIILVPHAPHPKEADGTVPGVIKVRAIQQRLARELRNCHDAGVIHGMDMEDNLHPSPRGVAQYGVHLADAFATLVLPRLRLDPIADDAAARPPSPQKSGADGACEIA